jgi:hypothetical protein
MIAFSIDEEGQRTNTMKLVNGLIRKKAKEPDKRHHRKNLFFGCPCEMIHCDVLPAEYSFVRFILTLHKLMWVAQQAMNSTYTNKTILSSKFFLGKSI